MEKEDFIIPSRDFKKNHSNKEVKNSNGKESQLAYVECEQGRGRKIFDDKNKKRNYSGSPQCICSPRRKHIKYIQSLTSNHTKSSAPKLDPINKINKC